MTDMASYTWIGASDGLFSTATNWSLAHVPGSGDEATIDLAGTGGMSLVAPDLCARRYRISDVQPLQPDHESRGDPPPVPLQCGSYRQSAPIRRQLLQLRSTDLARFST